MIPVLIYCEKVDKEHRRRGRGGREGGRREGKGRRGKERGGEEGLILCCCLCFHREEVKEMKRRQ